MIIGEAPGKTEVLEGRPFVGKSGQLLFRALQELGLERDDTYVTNVVDFHPKKFGGATRPPTEEECARRMGHLAADIYDVNPEIILALGNTAKEWVPICNIENVHTVYAWHPAFVERRGGHGSDTYKEWLKQLEPFV